MRQSAFGSDSLHMLQLSDSADMLIIRRTNEECATAKFLISLQQCASPRQPDRLLWVRALSSSCYARSFDTIEVQRSEAMREPCLFR